MVSIENYVSNFTSTYGKNLDNFISHLATDFKKGNISLDFAKEATRFAEYSDLFVEEKISAGFQKSSLGEIQVSELDGEVDLAANETVTLKYRAYHGPKGKLGTLKGFRNILAQLRKKTNNLSPLYKKISKDFFRTNKQEVFGKGSFGQRSFQPLTEIYARLKEKKYGPNLPILKATGVMEWHLTHYESPDAIHNEGKKTLELGTANERAIQHATGKSDSVKWRTGGTETTELPIRNPIFIGSQKRIIRWHNYARQHLTKLSKVELTNV